ncbi:hypothetical protein BRE01_28260 [Brevibacillus reuszeri]|uniref:O-antigen ligase-related domain-containing protein n=1 Tax=Brevibacillus reuszeri TaxID=54915 RepID=A0A0K9YIV1_9BACL|nr:O-antigen ligase [Brevibacillus reuszeri]KNB68623.1 hypothetical protein ADS79_32135 [Brevibacillus reuszeri]MED1858910.1 O-antigen ligase [Brevibacillus reuszeri]GED69124.1 hypothetical protein BRE01_28260 [Brevibacillus reuszeri]
MQDVLILETRASAMKKHYRESKVFIRFEQVFIIIALLLFSQAFFPFFQGGQPENVVEGNALLQLLWKIIYGVAFVLILIQRKRVLAILTRDKLSLLLLALIMLSFLWSNAPDITLRRSFAYFGTTLVAIYMAARFTLREQFLMVVWMLLGGAVCSLVITLVLPDVGKMLHEGSMAWRGIYSHKNQLGRLMCLGAIVFFLVIMMKQWPRWISWGGFLLCTSLLVLSESRTAIVVFVVLLGCIPFLYSFRWNVYGQLLLWMSATMLGVIFALVVVPNTEVLLESFGRDMTLTGRTELWATVIEMIREHPWFGYGYSGFWLGWDGESAYLWMVSNWNPPNSHNGFLDAALDVGVVGLIMILLSFFTRFIKAVQYIRTNQSWESFWPMLFLLYMVAGNVTETSLLDHNSFFWILFIAFGFSFSNKNGSGKAREQAMLTVETGGRR